MVRVLEEERDKIKNWKEIECVVLIIMSHGEGAYICGNDNNIIRLTDIIEVFDSQHCPCLDEKPRLVFVQACRSGKVINIENQHFFTDINDLL